MDYAELSMSVDTRDVDKGKRSVRGFTDETTKAGRTIASTTSAMAANWKVAAAAVAVAVTALRSLGGAIRVIREFEGSMAAVGAISRASAMDLAAMRDVAKDLGSTTEFTAAQAADGMKFLAMAGFNARDSMAAIPDVLDLATASGMGLASAADIASNIMSAFSVSAEDASDVTDALAAVASRANTSVEQLGDAMKFVGPVAAALGIGVNDAAAAMGVLSDNGLQGSMAGTGLRKVLSSLVNPTNEAVQALSAMGVAVEDVNPMTNDLTDIVDRLAVAGLDASDALTIFGDRGGPAILALTNSRGRLRELTAEMQNVDGAASDMAATMRDNLNGDVQSMVSAFQGLAIAIGDAGLTAILRGLIQTVTGLTRAFTSMVDAVAQLPSLIGEFLGFGAAQRELANAADAAAFAMNEEIAKSDALTGSLTSGRTMSVDTARVKLIQAQSHLATAMAMREENVENVKLSSAYQSLQVSADGARNMMRTLQDQAAAGILPDSAVVNIERARKILAASTNAMRMLEQEAGGTTEETQELERVIQMVETAIENADGDMVTLGGSIVNATGNAAALTSELQAAALAARSAVSNLEGGRSGGAGGEMVGGPRFKRQTIEEQAAPFLTNDTPRSSGGGGGGGGGQSQADQDKQAALQLMQSLRTEQQIYNDTLAEYQRLMTAGALSADQFALAQQSLNVKMAEAEYAQAINDVSTLADGLITAARNGDNLGVALLQMFATMIQQWLVAAIAAKAADIMSGGILGATLGAGGGGLAGMLFGGIGSNANGTNDWQGGMTMVGERGPELVNLPKGSQVIPNDRIGSHMKQPAPQVNMNPNFITVLDPSLVGQYMNTPEGEQAVMNIVSANQ
jgi:TP901 family phage tail tape measure protein